MLDAGAVDCLQADVTRCEGITGFLRVAALCQAALARALRATARRRFTLHALLRASRRFATSSTSTTTCASSGCSSTASLEPAGGVLRPDLSRPGNGLELKRADAER